ncbi:MAG: hypothetical protein WBQ73_02820 [Candidatus Babeliales bacterium]
MKNLKKQQILAPALLIITMAALCSISTNIYGYDNKIHVKENGSVTIRKSKNEKEITNQSVCRWFVYINLALLLSVKFANPSKSANTFDFMQFFIPKLS